MRLWICQFININTYCVKEIKWLINFNRDLNPVFISKCLVHTTHTCMHTQHTRTHIHTHTHTTHTIHTHTHIHNTHTYTHTHTHTTHAELSCCRQLCWQGWQCMGLCLSLIRQRLLHQPAKHMTQHEWLHLQGCNFHWDKNKVYYFPSRLTRISAITVWNPQEVKKRYIFEHKRRHNYVTSTQPIGSKLSSSHESSTVNKKT